MLYAMHVDAVVDGELRPVAQDSVYMFDGDLYRVISAIRAINLAPMRLNEFINKFDQYYDNEDELFEEVIEKNPRMYISYRVDKSRYAHLTLRFEKFDTIAGA